MLKEDIEQAIFDYNTIHFKEAHETKVYQDKIYRQLQVNEIRDKILDGRLWEEDYDDKEVFQFLSLLKQPTNRRNLSNREFKEVTQEQWTEEVKRAKKHSASSLFSKRTYSVYKCALESDRIT